MELLLTGDVAKRLGVTADRVRQLEREGRLVPQRTESGWRLYRRRDVEREIARRQQQTAEAAAVGGR